MFTGIVQAKGTVVSLDQHDQFSRLVISVPEIHLRHLNIGASIAVNGVCLTVTHFEVTNTDVVGQVFFDVIDETLAVTNLGQISQRDTVNIERSVTFGTEIGGHIVSGHVQTCAKIIDIQNTEHNCKMKLQVDPSWMKYILYKGFVAVDGISLTVGEVSEQWFVIHLIPETLQATKLGLVKLADKVNIEVDQQTFSVVKTVERILAARDREIDASYDETDW